MPMTVSKNSPPRTSACPRPRDQADEERRHRVEVHDGDADMVEASVPVTWGPSSRTRVVDSSEPWPALATPHHPATADQLERDPVRGSAGTGWRRGWRSAVE